MSKSLGRTYLSKEIRKFHEQRPDDLFVRNVQGHIVAMPRYYRKELFGEKLTGDQIKAAQDIHEKIRVGEERELQKKFEKGSVNTNILEDYERENRDYKRKKSERFQGEKRKDQ